MRKITRKLSVIYGEKVPCFARFALVAIVVIGGVFSGSCDHSTCLLDTSQSHFRFEDRDGPTLELFENDQLIFGYNYGEILAPGVPEDRRRSSYIHPVVGLDGEILSADFPKDHYHHRGLFWTWPRVGFEDRIVDQWHLDGARQRFERWEKKEVGPVCAVFAVKNGWFTNDGRKIVDEKVTIRTFRAGAIGRILDVDLQLEATTAPVTIAGRENEKKGYGGFCFRPASHRNEVITTVNGVQQDSNLIPSPWADFSANFGTGEEWSGVAIFQHKDNPLFPSGWCLRHYGFMGVDFPGMDPFVLKPGQPLRLQYRLWVHRGDADRGKVKEMYEAFLRTLASS